MGTGRRRVGVAIAAMAAVVLAAACSGSETVGTGTPGTGQPAGIDRGTAPGTSRGTSPGTSRGTSPGTTPGTTRGIAPGPSATGSGAWNRPPDGPEVVFALAGDPDRPGQPPDRVVAVALRAYERPGSRAGDVETVVRAADLAPPPDYVGSTDKPVVAGAITAFDVNPGATRMVVVARFGTTAVAPDQVGPNPDVRWALYELPLDGPDLGTIAPVEVVGPEGEIANVAYDPSGRRVAHDGAALGVRDLVDGRSSTIADVLLPYGAPGLTWSMDGTKVAFGSHWERTGCCGDTTVVAVGDDLGLSLPSGPSSVRGGTPWFDHAGELHTVTPDATGSVGRYAPADVDSGHRFVVATGALESDGSTPLAWWPTDDLDAAQPLGVLPAGLRAPRW